MEPAQVAAAGQSGLVVQPFHVLVHRAYRDVQPGGDLFAGQSLCDEVEHLGLAAADADGGERGGQVLASVAMPGEWGAGSAR